MVCSVGLPYRAWPSDSRVELLIESPVRFYATKGPKPRYLGPECYNQKSSSPKIVVLVSGPLFR